MELADLIGTWEYESLDGCLVHMCRLIGALGGTNRRPKNGGAYNLRLTASLTGAVPTIMCVDARRVELC